MYGILGAEALRITTTRKTLHVSYPKYKQSPDTHLAWLADATREMLCPTNLGRWPTVCTSRGRARLGTPSIVHSQKIK